MSVGVRPEFLRWTTYVVGEDESVEVRWGADEEGLLQVLRGDLLAERAGGRERLGREDALWLDGAQQVVLAATARAVCLEVRVTVDPGRGGALPIHWQELRAEPLHDALSGRSVAGRSLSAWHFDVAAGYVVDDLRHREEQISAPLDGAFTMLTGSDRTPLAPGEVAFVPTERRHGGDFADGRVTLLEAFCPKRVGPMTLDVESELR